jgi:hypothetical protein
MRQNEGTMVWRSDGFQFPNGIPFRFKYKGLEYFAVVENDALVLMNRRFSSLSEAASSITQKPFFEGLCFWECKFSPETGWESLLNVKNRETGLKQ